MRTERDSLGEKSVPDEALYGIHTCRSLDHFSVAQAPIPLPIAYGMARLKKACALANLDLGLLTEDVCKAIAEAADCILDGEFDDQFPIDLFQAGSGTSSNMNVNEVMANIACETLGAARGDRSKVHPNDHVNKGQSTNNIFPSAIRVACLEQIDSLHPALQSLIEALHEREEAFSHILKSGRTHLQDAVPITLGQEFGAWARAIEKDTQRIREASDYLLELGVGGNAVGTGLNTPDTFRAGIIAHLNADTGRTFRVAQQGLEATQFLTDLMHLCTALEAVATDLHKLANDLRLLASGPNTGLGDIELPAVEPGSSIMPGKINPSICEALNMACLQVLGLGHAVRLACASGQLELNTHMPLVGGNLIQMLGLLNRGARMVTEHTIRGIRAREDRCRAHFEQSAGLATILNPALGYDAVAKLVKESLTRGLTLRELALEKNLISPDDLQALIDQSTGPRPTHQ